MTDKQKYIFAWIAVIISGLATVTAFIMMFFDIINQIK